MFVSLARFVLQENLDMITGVDPGEQRERLTVPSEYGPEWRSTRDALAGVWIFPHDLTIAHGEEHLGRNVRRPADLG